MKINLIHRTGIRTFEWTIIRAKSLIRAWEQASKYARSVSLYQVLNLMLSRPVPGGPGYDGWTILWGQRCRVIKSFRVFTDRIEIATIDLSKLADVENLIRGGGYTYGVASKLKVRPELIRDLVRQLGLEEMARENGRHACIAAHLGAKRTHLKPEQRQTIERLLHSGRTVKEIHLQTSIPKGQIKHYILGTPFDQIAEENEARYHVRMEEQKRRARQEYHRGSSERPAADTAAVNASAFPPELVTRIEDLILGCGMTIPVACRQLQEEGFSISEYKLHRHLEAKPAVKEIATQNAFLYWCSHGGQTNKAEKPAFIYDRYYLLSKRDGILLVDRMSDRFSTDRYWMEWGIQTFRPHEQEQAERECHRRNACWHHEIQRGQY